MSRSSIGLSDSLQNYLLRHSVKSNKVKDALRAHTAKLAESNMQLSPEQGQFIQLLIQMIKAKRAIEIGTFTGYSALCIAEALPQDGVLIACDISYKWTAIAKQYWEQAAVADKIDLRIKPALETLQDLIDHEQAQTFDFVFIDADKENYIAYYEKALTLLRSGGVIAVDNVLWGGKVIESAMAADTALSGIQSFNHYIFNDERVVMSLLPIGDGLTVACKL